VAPAACGAMRIALNFLFFQAGWFACVLGAARGYPVAGAAIALGIAAAWVGLAARPSREAVLVGAAVALGLVLDTLLAQSGWLVFEGAVPFAAAAPVWMLALWALFAVTLNVSMRWLRDRPLLALVFGACGGPAAYAAGAGLGALRFEQQAAGLAAVAAGWALATPLLFAAARRLEAP